MWFWHDWLLCAYCPGVLAVLGVHVCAKFEVNLLTAQKLEEFKDCCGRGVKMCSCPPVFGVESVVERQIFAGLEHVF